MSTGEVDHGQRRNGHSSFATARANEATFDDAESFPRELFGMLMRRIEREVRARPLVTLGAAFGAGILIASSIRSKTARMALVGVASHYVRKTIGLM